eukprot:2639018-Prymnesium_polylepis.1
MRRPSGERVGIFAVDRVEDESLGESDGGVADARSVRRLADGDVFERHLQPIARDQLRRGWQDLATRCLTICRDMAGCARTLIA